jgi:hypothetical protein
MKDAWCSFSQFKEVERSDPPSGGPQPRKGAAARQVVYRSALRDRAFALSVFKLAGEEKVSFGGGKMRLKKLPHVREGKE